MSLRGMGLKGQQRRHVLVTDVTDVTDDVMRSAVRGESQRGYASGTPRPRQRTIAYLGTLPHEGASARERAQFWERLLPRLDRLRLEPAAYEHLMEQLVAVVPPPTRSKLAAADRDGAARAAKHAAWKARCRRRRARLLPTAVCTVHLPSVYGIQARRRRVCAQTGGTTGAPCPLSTRSRGSGPPSCLLMRAVGAW